MRGLPSLKPSRIWLRPRIRKRYAWGTIWTRDGLERTTRSAITLTALIAGGYWEELEMHVHAALRNGMSTNEIKEVFLQSAIYCSVPAANTAFKIGKDVLAEYAAREAAADGATGTA